MALPTSVPRAKAERSPDKAEPAYVCPNPRCLARAYERLSRCPECGNPRPFWLESDLRQRYLAVGVVFSLIGIILILLALWLVVANASGYFGHQTEEIPIWKPVAIISGIGALFLIGGIGTARGNPRFILFLPGNRR